MHDPLCPWNEPCPGSYEGNPHEFIALDSPDLDPVCYNCTSTECLCDLIAKVREDERQDAVQRVKDMPWTHDNWIAYDERAAVIQAIKGES